MVRTGLRVTLNLPYFLWFAATRRGAWKGRVMFRSYLYSRASFRFLEDNIRHGNLLLKCSLDEHSVVFDVGGHEGEWAQQIRERYNPNIHIFEPDHFSLDKLRTTYGGDAKVKFHAFGLAATDRTAILHHASMGSTIYSSSPAVVSESSAIALRDVRGVVLELGVTEIDLIKMNIEGGEYELLNRMIETGLHLRCRCIRVQFHEWIPGAHAKRRFIKAALGESHDIEWQYEFVWESWVRKDLSGRETATSRSTAGVFQLPPGLQHHDRDGV
jgi:FkbM family methyltransferase